MSTFKNYDDWFNAQLNAIGPWKWNATGVDAVLVSTNNATMKLEQLIDFCGKMGFDHIGAGNVEALFKAGFTLPEDVINATEQEIGGAIGSKVIGKKIFKSIHEKLTDVPEWLLMGSFPGFGRGIGRKKMKKLWEEFQGDMTQCALASNILYLDGFDHKSAVKVANGYPHYVAFVKAISKHVTFAKYQAKKAGGLTGQVIVLTGFRDSKLEEQIVENGGTVGSSVSGKTTLLVAADPDSTSGKPAKARELGVKIISVEEFRRMV